MNQDLKSFVISVLRAVLPALFVVASTAFITMPLVLGHHPGELANTALSMSRHMT